MISRIQELEQKCHDKTVAVSQVLLSALSIATKLNLTVDAQWINDEIKGYEKDLVPDYRIVRCDLKELDSFTNKYNDIELKKTYKKFSQARVIQSIGVLENLCDNPLVIKLTKDDKIQIRKDAINPILSHEINLHIHPIYIKEIIDLTRHKVLVWCLNLEKSGVLPEVMNILHEDKKTAKSTDTHFHIYGDSPVINPQGPVQVQTSTKESSQSLIQNTSDAEMIGKLFDLVNQFQEKFDSFSLTSSQKVEIEEIFRSLDTDLKSSSPKKSILKQKFDSLINFCKNHAFELADLALKFHDLWK